MVVRGGDGRPVYPPIAWIADACCPEADAAGWARVDYKDNPLGGYWFPASEEPEDADRWVSSRESIASDHLIQFPSEDRAPELGDGERAPNVVNDRHVDARLSPIADADDGAEQGGDA